MTSPRTLFKWLVAGVAVALVASALRMTESVMSSMADHGHDWWRIFAWQLAGWGFWTLAAPLLLRRGEALAEARPWWRALPSALATGLALIVVHMLFVALVVTNVQHFQPVAEYSFGDALSNQIENWRYVDLFAVSGLIGLGLILTSYHRARQLEVNESRLQAELAHAELEALRLQMEPHFLFNTLNSIAALVRRGDGERAVGMLSELGEMLRETLGRSRRDTVALADELAFVDRYVALQRERFGERLEVSTAVGQSCLELGVPTLSLQPLVENAIRHGMADRSEPIRIDVEAALENGTLKIAVRDDGAGLPEGFEIERDAGVGVGNLRSRLERTYGDRARLELERMSGGGTAAMLTLPAEPVGYGGGARGADEDREGASR